jgi:hypothetical protein
VRGFWREEGGQDASLRHYAIYIYPLGRRKAEHSMLSLRLAFGCLSLTGFSSLTHLIVASCAYMLPTNLHGENSLTIY